MSRDLDFSRAPLFDVKPFVMPPLQMLLEPHALLLPANEVLREPFKALLSATLLADMGLKDRDCPGMSA